MQCIATHALSSYEAQSAPTSHAQATDCTDVPVFTGLGDSIHSETVTFRICDPDG